MIDPERRKKVKAKIFAVLERQGYKATGFTWAEMMEKYPDIPKPTFYRWVKTLHERGAPAQNAIRQARKRRSRSAERKARQQSEYRARRDKDKNLEAVAENLPVIPDIQDPETARNYSITDLLDRLGGCVTRAELLEQHALGDDGKVRNAKLLLQASEHMRKTADTIAKLHAMLWDVQRTEMLHRAIFRHLSRRDPTLVRDILADLRAVNMEFGIRV